MKGRWYFLLWGKEGSFKLLCRINKTVGEGISFSKVDSRSSAFLEDEVFSVGTFVIQRKYTKFSTFIFFSFKICF